MQRTFLKFFVFPLFLFYSISIAQNSEMKFISLNVEHGLSQNQVYCIHQDKLGFLWIGTQDGLNRYDGYIFKAFRHEPENPNSLSDYAVNKIAEDKYGMLWIATREGLNRFDPASEEFKRYLLDEKNIPNTSSNNSIWALLADDDILWIGTRKGINKLDIKSDKFLKYSHEENNSNSLSNNNVTSIAKDNFGNLWIGTSNGLNRFDIHEEKFYRYYSDINDPNTISNNLIRSIIADGKNGLWIGTADGLNYLHISDLAHPKIIRINNQNGYDNISDNLIVSLFLTKNNDLLIGTYNGGLNKLNLATKEITVYKNNPDDPSSISTNFIRSIYEDNSGVIWIGTNGGGLNKFSPFSNKFFHVDQKRYSNILSSNSVLSFHVDGEDNLWIGTEAGVSKINLAALIGKQKIKSEKPEELNNLAISSIAEDNKGNIFFSTFGNGFFKLKKGGKNLKHFKQEENKNNTLSNNFIHKLFIDGDEVWIGTGIGGLAQYNSVLDSFKTFKPDPKNPNSISSREIISIAKDDEGFMWFGSTTGGLNKFDKNTGLFTRYEHDQNDIGSLRSSRVNTLFKDSKGNLWIATFGGGLNKFDKKNNRFIHYTEKDGLGGNIIYGMEEDEKGNLWLSTNKGITKFNAEKKLIKNYNISDGVQGRDFHPNSSFKEPKSGYLFFGGLNGFNYFHPDSIKESSILPKTIITDFQILNNTVPVGKYKDGSQSPLEKSILFSEEINLSPNDNIFSFEFAAMHFAEPEKNQYAYMMEGFDEDWIYSGTRRFANYTNLDPGTYVFKVKGSNSDGVWNEQAASVKINILPPWWKTWWAYILYALLFISAIFGVRRYEINRARLKTELNLKHFETAKLQEVDQMKSRFFANISHEFRTPLTLILGLLEELIRNRNLKENESDLKVMKSNARRLLQLINQLLELSKLESGSDKIKAQKIELIKFVSRLASSFISFAEQKNIRLNLNGNLISALSNGSEIFVYIDPEKIETVIFNLLSNAVKFTPEGEKIDIDISSDKWHAEISITNTGISIPAEKLPHVFDRFYQVDDSGTRGFEGTGIGLALVKELTELHHGEVKAYSIEGKETSFRIILPLGRAHFTSNEIAEDEIAEDEIRASVKKDHISLLDLSEEEAPAIISSDIKKENKDANIVLIVEDNFDLRNFIRMQLKNEYSVVEAEDGVKGVKLAGEIIPDLIISDIMMPKKDGYSLCKEIKTNIKTNHIPVILLTAKAGTENKIEGLETGADDYLIKPFNTDELKARVKNLINLRIKMREKYQSEMLIKPSDVVVPSTQKLFIEKLSFILEEHLDEERFGIENLCLEIGMSRAQLHRKIKAVTNQSTSEFIRVFRLRRAADLIKQNAGNMAEIAYRVGFSSQAYFTKSFQNLYGCSPSEFKKKDLIK